MRKQEKMRRRNLKGALGNLGDDACFCPSDRGDCFLGIYICQTYQIAYFKYHVPTMPW